MSTFGLRACPVLYDIASEIHIGTAVSLLKADRLEAYPTFSRVDCEVKPLHEPYGKIHYRGLDPKKREPPTGGAQTEGKRVTSSSAS